MTDPSRSLTRICWRYPVVHDDELYLLEYEYGGNDEN